MNKINRTTYIFITALLMLTPMYAQIPSPITLQIGGGIGSVSPRGDFSGTTMEYYSGTTYGQSGGINYQGKARLGILGFNIVGEIDYASFSNSGNSEPGKGSIDISQKVFSMKVGPEFKLNFPLIPLTPYVGANLSLNRFSGDVTFQGVSKVPSGNFPIKTESRVGFGFSGGVIFNFAGLSFDVGVQYNMLNAFGKSWEDVNPTQDQRLDSYLALNDDKDPLYSAGSDKHFINNSRSLNSFAITATVMFGLF